MADRQINTSYRTWPDEDLQALRLSTLTQLKAIEGVGQSHSQNGKSTTLTDFEKLTNKLEDINAAIAWKKQQGNRGNAGYASRYSSYGY